MRAWPLGLGVQRRTVADSSTDHCTHAPSHRSNKANVMPFRYASGVVSETRAKRKLRTEHVS